MVVWDQINMWGQAPEIQAPGLLTFFYDRTLNTDIQSPLDIATLDIATLDIAAALPIATSTTIELGALALHK